MAATRIISLILACSLAGVLFTAAPAAAVIDSGTIVVNTPTGTILESVSVTTVAIVTNPAVGRVSYIEIFFATADAPVGLRIESRDQRRIETFYDQILKSAAAHQEFQITAYTTGTFPSNGYIVNLDTGSTYFIIH